MPHILYLLTSFSNTIDMESLQYGDAEHLFLNSYQIKSHKACLSSLFAKIPGKGKYKLKLLLDKTAGNYSAVIFSKEHEPYRTFIKLLACSQ